jgi:hypothetical protein
MQSRQQCFNHYVGESSQLRGRAARIHKLITQYKPPFVVFYGDAEWRRRYWEAISGIDAAEWDQASPWTAFAKNQATPTLFAIAPHPTRRDTLGIADNLFWSVGETFRSPR